MRIGLFGNTNNYPLQLALALKDLGHEPMLVVNRREALHRPESRLPHLAAGYPPWILDCSDVPEEEFIVGGLRVQAAVNFLASGSAGVVLNDLGPSLLEFCGDVPAVSFMTGSDLTGYASTSFPRARSVGWDPSFVASPGGQLVIRRLRECAVRQRAGIGRSGIVSAPPRGVVPAMDQVLDEIGVADERRAFFYFSDARLQPAEPSRGRRGLRVVNAARLNWRRPLPEGFSSQDHKGTDVLLRGAAAFLAGGGHLTLSLFRKGIDVAATESLVADLGLSGVVEWHDEMDLHRFHGVLADADVVCDQLGDAFPGMAMLDAMALGRPVIANLPAALTAGRYPEPWPVRQASTVEDVTAHLAALADDEVRVEAARQTAAFATRHLSAVAAARICVRHFHESAPCREEKAS